VIPCQFSPQPSGRASTSSNYDDYPAPDFPNNSPPRVPPSSRSGRTSADRPSDSGYGSVSSRRSEDKRRPSESDSIPVGRRSEESFRRMEDAYAVGRNSEDSYTPSVATSRRKPSQDTTRRSEDRERERDFGRRPSAAVSVSGTTDSASTANPAQSTTATSGMIIPNKSTIEEEYIEVPYGRDVRESGSTMMDERERSREPSGDAGRLTDGELDNGSDFTSPLSPRSPPAGLSGLSARLKGVEAEDDERGIPGVGGRGGDDYYDKYGRSSVNSDHSVASGSGTRMLAGRATASEDQEKMKRDYEFRIATMQTQITTLQRDLGDTGERERKWKEGEAKVRHLEEELIIVRRASISFTAHCMCL
jgi:protein SPA2